MAEEGDEDALSVTSFDIMPEGVPVPAGSNIARFPAQEMARFKPEEGLALNVGGKTIKLTDNVLRELMTPEQFDELRGQGYAVAQGYLFARPLDPGELEVWVNNHPDTLH